MSPRGQHRAPAPNSPTRSIWKNPRIVIALILLGFLVVSLSVEQATKGEYATPSLVGDILKISIPAFFTAGGLSEVMRYLNRKGSVQNLAEGEEELETTPPTPPRESDTT